MTDFDRGERRLRDVCAAWLGRRAVAIEPLAAGGFSGASMLRVRDPDSGLSWVLKSVPRSVADHVAWVHALMRHMRLAGVAEVPTVAVTPAGASLVFESDGDAWELVAFVAGLPTTMPTMAQAAAATTCLARIHAAAATFAGAVPRRAVPAAVGRRVTRAAALLAAPWRATLAHPDAGGGIAWRDAVGPRLERAVAIFEATDGSRALARVAALVPGSARVQAVLRDVGGEHVLYDTRTSPRVAGVIDFHAAAIDTPATDLARLLGSWRAARDGDLWNAALAAYEQVRPLEPDERAAVAWLDATGVIFGLDNWFRWTLTEGRRFPDPVAVAARIDGLLDRLPGSVADLHDDAGHAV